MTMEPATSDKMFNHQLKGEVIILMGLYREAVDSLERLVEGQGNESGDYAAWKVAIARAKVIIKKAKGG